MAFRFDSPKTFEKRRLPTNHVSALVYVHKHLWENSSLDLIGQQSLGNLNDIFSRSPKGPEL
jgi:hypothetical protein